MHTPYIQFRVECMRRINVEDGLSCLSKLHHGLTTHPLFPSFDRCPYSSSISERLPSIGDRSVNMNTKLHRRAIGGG